MHGYETDNYSGSFNEIDISKVSGIFHSGSPVINTALYPEVSEEVFTMMEQECCDKTFIYLFPFVRKNDDAASTLFIDIYLWDAMLYPENYIRFVFVEGYRMDPDIESAFIKYLHNPLIRVDGERMSSFSKKVVQLFPNWHYKEYPLVEMPTAFEHIYFASHRSGPKEILFKAELPNLAMRVYEIPDCNLIGTTPSEIIGHDLPIRLLRIIDQPCFNRKQFDEEWFVKSKAVYHEYSGYIGKNLPNVFQWNYLTRLYDNGGTFAGRKFIRSLYKRIRYSWNEELLDYYEKFIVLRDGFIKTRKLKLPNAYDVMYVVAKLEALVEMMSDPDIDKRIRERKKRKFFEYADEKYSVIMPGSSMDFYNESLRQSSCVMDYTAKHASGETTILLLRENEKLEKPYVTVEVKDGEITQVYGKFNTLPSKDVYIFLMEYARKRWLYCNPYDLIMDAFPEDDTDYVISEELCDFAMSFCKQKTEDIAVIDLSDEEEYAQLSLKDLYPEAFVNIS